MKRKILSLWVIAAVLSMTACQEDSTLDELNIVNNSGEPDGEDVEDDIPPMQMQSSLEPDDEAGDGDIPPRSKR